MAGVEIFSKNSEKLSEEIYQSISALNAEALASPRSAAPKAVLLLREALAKAKQTDDQLFCAQTQLNLARWLGNAGAFKEAFEHLAEAKRIFTQRQDLDALLDVELVHALILYEFKAFDEAMEKADLVYQKRRALRLKPDPSVLVPVSSDRL